MPKGPLSGPRPATKATQRIEAPLYGGGKTPQWIEDNVREFFPHGTVGGKTNDSITGAIGHIDTKQQRVYLDTVEKLLDKLGEDVIAQNAWGVAAEVRGPAGEKRPAAQSNQTVRLKYEDRTEVLSEVGRELEPFYMAQLTERGFPGGAKSPAMEPDAVNSISVDSPAHEVVVSTNLSSVDSSKVAAMRSRIIENVSGAVNHLEQFSGVDTGDYDTEVVEEMVDIDERIRELTIADIIIEAQ